jgi:integrase
MKINAANERLKHRYFIYLREARQLGEHSIDQVAKALDRFEEQTRRRPFREFRTEQAVSFKRALSHQRARRSEEPLSRATVSSTLYALRDFFVWLSDQRGFRNRLQRSDADYFRPSRSYEAVARARRPKPVPSLDQIRAMLDVMPSATSIDRRNRAIVALTILTGARDNAIASLRLKHLDLADRQLFQDAREVRTKFSKTFPTWFFPVGQDFVVIVADWKQELEAVHGYRPDDPLFPQTEVPLSAGGDVLLPRLKRQCWANADPIRKVFKQACGAAALPDFRPHSFRHTLAQLADDFCTTPGDYKSWSQNLGHEDVLVTLTSYGTVPNHKQRATINGMWQKSQKAISQTSL